MGAGLPMGAPMSGAVARLGKSGGAAPALPKHRADGLEAWGKARNSHRSSPAKGHPTHPTKGHHPSDSSTPHPPSGRAARAGAGGAAAAAANRSFK